MPPIFLESYIIQGWGETLNCLLYKQPTVKLDGVEKMGEEKKKYSFLV